MPSVFPATYAEAAANIGQNHCLVAEHCRPMPGVAGVFFPFGSYKGSYKSAEARALPCHGSALTCSVLEVEKERRLDH
jgi:hypothetical protein